MDMHEMVLEFHRKFGQHIGEQPGFPDTDTLDLRLKLIREEHTELYHACLDRNLTEVADALADLLYVTIGTAIAFGIDIRPVLAEVHRTNMLKEVGRLDGDGKIMKPPGWQPPRIAPLLKDMRIK